MIKYVHDGRPIRLKNLLKVFGGVVLLKKKTQEASSAKVSCICLVFLMGRVHKIMEEELLFVGTKGNIYFVDVPRDEDHPRLAAPHSKNFWRI